MINYPAINKFKVLLIVSLLCLFASCKSKQRRISKEDIVNKNRPNIILMMSDDMGFECLSSNGSTSYNTPILDELATNGLKFTNCFSQPLCTPSRVKIMTGKTNNKNYIDFGYLDPFQKTFGNVMRDAGYKTLVAGKWQLNGVHTQEKNCYDLNRPDHFGFDEHCLWWVTSQGSRYSNPRIITNKQYLKTTIDDYGPDIISDYVVNFIEENKDQPFFVYYPMVLVHSPFQPTPDSPEWSNVKTRSKINNKYFKDMVEYTDKIVGKIKNKLDELRLTDNTIFIFTGDNGTHTKITSQTKNGDYSGGKGLLTDNGTHVPLIINYPNGTVQGKTYDGLIEFSDFLPTFAESANIPVGDDIDGKSFFKLINNQDYKPKESIFIHYWPRTHKIEKKNGCFARTVDFKLYSTGDFFDMANDKWEKNPLNIATLNRHEKDVYLMLQAELKNRDIWDFTTIRRPIEFPKINFSKMR